MSKTNEEPVMEQPIEGKWYWVSVKDRLPDMETVLVSVSATEDFPERTDVAFYNSNVKKWGIYQLHDWAGGEITHWMPFPQPMPAPYVSIPAPTMGSPTKQKQEETNG